MAWAVATIHLPSGLVMISEKVTPFRIGRRTQPRCFLVNEENTAPRTSFHGLSSAVKWDSEMNAKSASALRMCWRKRRGLSGNFRVS